MKRRITLIVAFLGVGIGGVILGMNVPGTLAKIKAFEAARESSKMRQSLLH